MALLETFHDRDERIAEAPHTIKRPADAAAGLENRSVGKKPDELGYRLRERT
jgi:hypothetical protein